MKNMIICSALLLSSTMAFAQPESNYKHMDKETYQIKMQERQAKMAEELKLTEDQQVKVKASMEKYKSSIEYAREVKRAEMEAILTPEQQAQVKEMKGLKGKKGMSKHKSK